MIFVKKNPIYVLYIIWKYSNSLFKKKIVWRNEKKLFNRDIYRFLSSNNSQCEMVNITKFLSCLPRTCDYSCYYYLYGFSWRSYPLGRNLFYKWFGTLLHRYVNIEIHIIIYIYISNVLIILFFVSNRKNFGLELDFARCLFLWLYNCPSK